MIPCMRQITLLQPLERIARYPLLHHYWFIMGVYVVITLIVTLQNQLLHEINNFYIFKYSFPHLIHNQNIYGFFEAEYYDNYKYGPVFAVFIAPIAVLPNGIGIYAWTMLNTCLFVYALFRLPLAHTYKVGIAWIVFLEFLTSTQNMQANPMLTAFLVLIFVFFERKKVFWAALFVALGGFFKIYGFIGAALFLLYPQKLRFIASFLFWCVVLFFLPLLVVSFDQLLYLYKEWYLALVEKTGFHHDISFLRNIHSMVHASIPNSWIIGAGILMFGAAYLRWTQFEFLNFRLLFLSSIFLWVVIFSPGSESPTYVIAVTGVAIWYVLSSRAGWQTGLLVFVLVLTCLSPGDLFPKYIRQTYVIPYALKALPCVCVWFVVMYELLNRKFTQSITH